MKIEVTQDDIKFGQRRKACECPVAQAIRRRIPSVFELSVGRTAVVIGFVKDKPVATLPLPHEVTRFINDFDTFEEVAPFSFELEIPA